MITIKDMLAIMDSGAIFSCKVIAYDRTRKKGGEILDYPEAVLVRKNTKKKAGQRSLTTHEKRQLLETNKPKNPRHKQWYTRNIRLCVNQVPTAIIKKIHPPLVVEFNGQQIIV